MNRNVKILLAAALAAASVTGAYAFLAGKTEELPPEIPAKPEASPVSLVFARPFTLDEAAVHYWRAEQPSYDAGYVMVLAVDPQLVHPRQGYEAVLYVGDQTAERVNQGHESGHVVVIVPAPKSADGGVALDLAAAIPFFGSPALPEQVDAAIIAAQLAAAKRAGAVAPPATAVAEALAPAVEFANDYELRLYCADLVAQYSPLEVDLVNGLRAPRVGH
jgi:hypothetical protein